VVKDLSLRLTVLCGLLTLVMVVGCSSVATRKGFYDPIITDIRMGDFDSAVVKIELAKESDKYSKKDRFLYYIDAGLACHYANQHETSNEKLTLAEKI